MTIKERERFDRKEERLAGTKKEGFFSGKKNTNNRTFVANPSELLTILVERIIGKFTHLKFAKCATRAMFFLLMLSLDTNFG